MLWQDAEKARRRRSRIVQRLNVPERTPPSLAAALLDSLFEPPEVIWREHHRENLGSLLNINQILHSLLENAYQRVGDTGRPLLDSRCSR